MNRSNVTVLGDLMVSRAGSVNPSTHPNEVFELYSIPAFDGGEPEVVSGGEIGSAKQVVKPGDVLLSKIVPHIRRAWVVGKAQGRRLIASGEWIVFRSDRANPAYLRHILTSDHFHSQFMSTVAGVGGSLLRARPAQVAGLTIPLPPLPEQQRIADILDKADAIRRKKYEALGVIAELSRSQLDQWFRPWFLTGREAVHVPVSHFVERFEGGLNVATPDRPTTETKNYILKVSAVTSGEYRPEEAKPLYPDYNPPSSHFVRERDLLFSRANTTELVGATAYIFRKSADRVLPDKLWRFVWKNSHRVEPLFVWALFNHPKVRQEIGRRATGTSGSMKNISMQKVMSLRVPFPEIEKQRQISSFLEQQQKLIDKTTISARESDTLFNSLVQLAFRGEL